MVSVRRVGPAERGKQNKYVALEKKKCMEIHGKGSGVKFQRDGGIRAELWERAERLDYPLSGARSPADRDGCVLNSELLTRKAVQAAPWLLSLTEGVGYSAKGWDNILKL